MSIEEFYNKYAEKYEYIYKDYLEESIKTIRNILSDSDIPNNKKCLLIDLGCGIGSQIREVKNILCEKNNEVVAIGIDISNEMIKKAKEKNNEIIYVEGDFLDTTKILSNLSKITNNDKFDFILIMCLGNTLAHVSNDNDNYSKFFDTIKRVLKTFDEDSNYLILLEFRDGKILSLKKPLFEKRFCGLIDNKLFLSFYFMNHQKESNTYPTTVYLFAYDYNNYELKIETFKNDISYYVDTEKLSSFVTQLGLKEEKKSPLKFGKIWVIRSKSKK